MFGKGLLGVAAFAALAIGAERDADACGSHNPVPPCGVAVNTDGTVDVAQAGTSIATPVSAGTVCTTCGGNLSPGVSVVATKIVDPNAPPGGDNGAGFCGSGEDPAVADAFAGTLGGAWQGGTAFALARNIPAGAPIYYVTRYRSDRAEFRGELGVAEAQLVGRSYVINAAHIGTGPFDTSTCTPCTADNALLAECKAITDAFPTAPTLAQKALCARTDAATMLGLEIDESSGDSGCSAARGGASALALGLVGLVLGIRRRRRS